MPTLTPEHALVPWRAPEDMKRRNRLEADPEAWLKHYLAFAYTRPFEKPHKKTLDTRARLC